MFKYGGVSSWGQIRISILTFEISWNGTKDHSGDSSGIISQQRSKVKIRALLPIELAALAVERGVKFIMIIA